MTKKLLCAALLGGLFSLLAAGEFQTANPLGWVFRTGEKATAALTGAPSAAITVTDFYGKPRTVSAAADGSFQVPTDVPGYFVLKHGERTQSFAVIPPVPAHDAEQSPFGVNFHLTRVPLDQAKREVRMAQFIGCDWGRGVLPDWSDIRADETDGTNLLNRYAPLFDFLKESGLHSLGGIYFVPRYASGAPEGSEYIVYSRVPGDDLAPATEFSRELAKRCPFIRHWEIGNESDAEVFWRGRWKNFLAGDDAAIIGDYVDFLAAGGKGFREGGGEGVRILFTGPTGMTGHTYRPFFATSLAKGAADHFDIMNIHYRTPIGEVRRIMAEQKVAAKPVWVTELGSSSGGHGRTPRSQIVEDLMQQVEHLADGAEKLFKYDFRDDGTNPNDAEHNFGMVKRDFSPKPNYAANATLNRMLLNTRFEKELNVVKAADSGYLKGYAFAAPGGKMVNVFCLNAAKKAEVTLKTPDQELIFTDVMGVEKPVPAKDGVVRLTVDELPFFVTGRIADAPGKPVYPEDKLVRTIPLPLKNPGFEEGGLAGWQPTFSKEITKWSIVPGSAGKNALRIDVAAPGESDFRCVFQSIDLKPWLAQLKPNEYLKLKVSCSTRRENAVGRGSTLAGLYYNAEGKRIGGVEEAYRTGTHGWRTLSATGNVPTQAVRLGVEYYIAPKTTGRFEVDDIRAELEVWKRPE